MSYGPGMPTVSVKKMNHTITAMSATVTEKVIAFDYHVTGMQPEPQPQCAIVLAGPCLHHQRTAQGLHG